MKRRGELLFTGIFLFLLLLFTACKSPVSQSGGAHVFVKDFKHMGGGMLDLHFGWDIGDKNEFTFTRSLIAKCNGETKTIDSYQVTKNENMTVRDRIQFPERQRASCHQVWVKFKWTSGSTSTKRLNP